MNLLDRRPEEVYFRCVGCTKLHAFPHPDRKEEEARELVAARAWDEDFLLFPRTYVTRNVRCGECGGELRVAPPEEVKNDGR